MSENSKGSEAGGGTAPERVWLQPDGRHWEVGEWTWCWHRVEADPVHPNDIEYIRTDLAAYLAGALGEVLAVVDGATAITRGAGNRVVLDGWRLPDRFEWPVHRAHDALARFRSATQEGGTEG